jgi:hypothetical protein
MDDVEGDAAGHRIVAGPREDGVGTAHGRAGEVDVVVAFVGADGVALGAGADHQHGVVEIAN